MPRRLRSEKTDLGLEPEPEQDLEPEPEQDLEPEPEDLTPIPETPRELTKRAPQSKWEGRLVRSMNPETKSPPPSPPQWVGRAPRYMTQEQIDLEKRKTEESVKKAHEKNLKIMNRNPYFLRFYKDIKKSLESEINGILEKKHSKEIPKKMVEGGLHTSLGATLGLLLASFVPGGHAVTGTLLASYILHSIGHSAIPNGNPFENKEFKTNVLIIICLFLLRENINTAVNNGRNKQEKLDILSNKIKEIYMFLYESLDHQMDFDIDFMSKIFFDIFNTINQDKLMDDLAKNKKVKTKKKKVKTKKKKKRTKK